VKKLNVIPDATIRARAARVLLAELADTTLKVARVREVAI